MPSAQMAPPSHARSTTSRVWHCQPVVSWSKAKCAGAGRRRCRGHHCDARRQRAGGQTDWSPLAGKAVLIWPDRDKPGWDYAMAAAQAMVAAGAASSRRCCCRPTTKPDGWDAADAMAEGFDVDAFLETGRACASSRPAPCARRKPRCGRPTMRWLWPSRCATPTTGATARGLGQSGWCGPARIGVRRRLARPPPDPLDLSRCGGQVDSTGWRPSCWPAARSVAWTGSPAQTAGTRRRLGRMGC